ncbi:MAG TPA: NAD(P)-binding domain-containing protein [Stellaceae bacterium]|nr:NAD(P)-binding domain-containing protein [Stellaceae bacterium]
MLRLGFVGTGALSEAVVRGLQDGKGEEYEIYLSPRSEERSRALSIAYDNVVREESNEAVVEKSDVVFLGVLPRQLSVLSTLPFRSNQIVVSFLAGAPLDIIREQVKPATRIIRVIPLPSIRYKRGPILMTPDDPIVRDLFTSLGDLVVLDDEKDFAAITIASGMMSSHFELQNTIIRWLEARKVPSPSASLYVRSFFDGLSEIGLATERLGEAVQPKEYETPGGLNETGRAHLKTSGWFEQLTSGLDVVENHSRGLAKRD